MRHVHFVTVDASSLVDARSPFKEYGKLLVESSVLLSTNPTTADTLRLFKYVGETIS